MPRGGAKGSGYEIILLAAQTSPPKIEVSSNSANGPGISVQVGQVILSNTPERPLYNISYTYNFEGRKTVFVSGGLGLVLGQGSFHYFSRDLELDFSDPDTGALIVAVPLKVTFVPQGSATDDTPVEPQFVSFGQDDKWSGDTPHFKQHLDDVLNSIPLGSQPCYMGSPCAITAPTALNFAAKHGEKGRVSFKIMYFYSTTSVQFRIEASAQEKLTHGSWLKAEDSVVVDAARQYTNDLLKKIGSSK